MDATFRPKGHLQAYNIMRGCSIKGWSVMMQDLEFCWRLGLLASVWWIFFSPFISFPWKNLKADQVRGYPPIKHILWIKSFKQKKKTFAFYSMIAKNAYCWIIIKGFNFIPILLLTGSNRSDSSMSAGYSGYIKCAPQKSNLITRESRRRFWQQISRYK